MEEVMYQSPGGWIEIIKTPRGFYYARRKNKDSVAVFIVRRHPESYKWEVLIRQQPLPIHNADLDSEQKLFDCPVTGGLDSEGEPPFDCAVREVFEETGYKVDEVRFLASYVVGTQSDETVYMYWVDVSRLEPSAAAGDGTWFEGISKNEWKSIASLLKSSYAACQIGYYYLCKKLNIVP